MNMLEVDILFQDTADMALFDRNLRVPMEIVSVIYSTMALNVVYDDVNVNKSN